MITKPDEAIFVSVKEDAAKMGVKAAAKMGVKAAAKMGVTCSRLYQLFSAGQFPAFRRGRRVFIPARAFDNFAENVNRQALKNLREPEKGHLDV